MKALNKLKLYLRLKAMAIPYTDKYNMSKTIETFSNK